MDRAGLRMTSVTYAVETMQAMNRVMWTENEKIGIRENQKVMK